MDKFLDLLDVVLSQKRAQYTFVNFEGYFDESETERGKDLSMLCVGGFVLRPSAARELHKKWHRVLKKHDLPYFHMVECANEDENGQSVGIFKGKSKSEKIEIQTQLILLIKQYVEFGIITASPVDGEIIDTDTEKTVYGEMVRELGKFLIKFVGLKYPDFSLSLFFEQGHQHFGSAIRALQRSPEVAISSYSFIKKQTLE